MEKTGEQDMLGMYGALMGLLPLLPRWGGGNREPMILEFYEYNTCENIEKQ